MAEKSVRRNEYLIDPLFAIPEGLDEFVYDDDNYTATDSELIFSDGDYDEGEYPIGEGDGGETSTALPVPELISIVSQTLRTGPGGTQVVDLVVDVEDLPGVTEYEFRVTKL